MSEYEARRRLEKIGSIERFYNSRSMAARSFVAKAMKWKDKYGWLVEWLDKKREEARSELKRQKMKKSCRHNNHREKTVVAVDTIKKSLIVEKIEEPVVIALKLPVELNSPEKSISSAENIVVKENEPQNYYRRNCSGTIR
jgi:hypothetical protein